MFIKDGATTTGSTTDPIIVTGQFNTNLSTDKTTIVDAGTIIDGANLYGTDKTGFIKNYLYPAFLFTCSETTDG